jgi:hypothetical protein
MMEQIKNRVEIFTTLKYLFKFIFNKLGELRKEYINYRDNLIKNQKEENMKKDIKEEKVDNKIEAEEIKEKNIDINKSKIIRLKQPKSKKLSFPILVLFDAENMPIQRYYKLVNKIVVEKFGKKSWKNAKLETAYQESTEFFNNKGFNRDIKTHYVSRGKDKADDKLVEIAKESKIPTIVIVTNDKELIERLQAVASRNPSGKLFVVNGEFIKDYTLTEKEVELVKLRDLKIKREMVLKELEIIERDIVDIEKRHNRDISIIPLTSKLDENRREELKRKQESKKVEVVISNNLKRADIDDNIRKEMMTNSLFIGFTEELEQVSIQSDRDILKKIREILEIFSRLPRTKNLLEREGINISTLNIAMKYAINGFDQSKYKGSDFVNLIIKAIESTNIKLVLKGVSEYRLLYRDTPIDELDTVDVTLQSSGFNEGENQLTERFGNSLMDLAFFKK